MNKLQNLVHLFADTFLTTTWHFVIGCCMEDKNEKQQFSFFFGASIQSLN